MDGFTLYILSAFALIFVIEGLMYVLFPDFIRKMMAMAITMDTHSFRTFGFLMAGIGAFTVWILQKIAGG